MTYSAALTRLQALSVTGVNSNTGAINKPPHRADLPVLITEETSQPFAESFTAWNVALTSARFRVFVDHTLLICGHMDGSFLERETNIILFTDRYLTAIGGDLTLNDTLAIPLSIIVIKRGTIALRNSLYSGIRFRHFWEIAI